MIASMNLTNNITSTSGSRDISMPIVHNILINPMIIQSIFKNIQWWSIYNIIWQAIPDIGYSKHPWSLI